MTRRQGGTLSRRYRSNGYVLNQQNPGRLLGRHREQALLPQADWGLAQIFQPAQNNCGSELARDGGGSVDMNAN